MGYALCNGFGKLSAAISFTTQQKLDKFGGATYNLNKINVFANKSIFFFPGLKMVHLD